MVDNEIKLQHLAGRLLDAELAEYFESVKTLTAAQLQEEIKTLKRAKLNSQIAKLQDDLSRV